jgi:hypothetical protein
MVAAGVTRAELRSLARAVAYAAVFDTLRVIDAGQDPTVEPDVAPGWRLVETDASGALTGCPLWSLYESLLSVDPTGQEGRQA